jgi:steroid delta-isomerase-like uncharacterized protein
MERLLSMEAVMSQIEKNRSLVTRYVAAMNARDVDALNTLVAEGLINHAALPEVQGRAGMRVIAQKLTKAFPDGSFKVEDVIAENDRVVCRMTFTGTNSGDLEFTRWPLKATNRRIEVEHLHVFRIEGEQIVEHWACRDDFAMMRQLGVGPGAQS